MVGDLGLSLALAVGGRCGKEREKVQVCWGGIYLRERVDCQGLASGMTLDASITRPGNH